MHVTLMMEKLYQFPNETFTIDDFLDKFDSPAWNEGNTKQNLRTMLELTPEYKDGLLQFNDLLLLSILWCAGDMVCKAEAFFKCLNPPGQSQDGISANDKDWDSVFDKLVYLASIFTYKVAAAFGETVEEYDEDFHKKAIKVMRTSEIEPDEDPHKAGFLNIVYGFESRLDR